MTEDQIITIEGEAIDESTLTTDERRMLCIAEAVADTFSKMSLLLRDVRTALPEDLLRLHPEIVGAALDAHRRLLLEELPELRHRVIEKFSDIIYTRVKPFMVEGD